MPSHSPKRVLLSEKEFRALYPTCKDFRWQKLQGLCRLIVVRHGESTSNASAGDIRIAGRKLDVSLTTKGHQQAAAAAKMLQQLLPDPVTAFYSSPLKRAMESADTMRKAMEVPDTPLLPDERLYETWYAELEGASAAQYDPHDERQSLELSALPSFAARMEYRLVADMENMREVFQRTTACLKEVARQHLGQAVVLTTHNGPVKSLFMHFVAQDKGYDLLYDSFNVGNASILIFESDGETLWLKSVDGLGLRQKAKL